MKSKYRFNTRRVYIGSAIISPEGTKTFYPEGKWWIASDNTVFLVRSSKISGMFSLKELIPYRKDSYFDFFSAI